MGGAGGAGLGVDGEAGEGPAGRHSAPTPYPLRTLPGREGRPHPVDAASPPQTVTGRVWLCVYRAGQAWGCPTPPPLPCGEHAAQGLVAEAAPMLATWNIWLACERRFAGGRQTRLEGRQQQGVQGPQPALNYRH